MNTLKNRKQNKNYKSRRLNKLSGGDNSHIKRSNLPELSLDDINKQIEDINKQIKTLIKDDIEFKLSLDMYNKLDTLKKQNTDLFKCITNILKNRNFDTLSENLKILEAYKKKLIENGKQLSEKKVYLKDLDLVEKNKQQI